MPGSNQARCQSAAQRREELNRREKTSLAVIERPPLDKNGQHRADDRGGYSAQHEACEKQYEQVAVTVRPRGGSALFVLGQAVILRDTALSSNFALLKNPSDLNWEVRYSLAFRFAKDRSL